MVSIPMTARGFKKLREELEELVTFRRPDVIAEVEKARGYGDLSENAEYHAAKERQREIEDRIQELQSKLSRARIVDPSFLSGPKICFGAHVVLYEESVDKEYTYQIVGTDEANIQEGLISVESSLARELIGRCEGDTVEMHNPHSPQKDRSYVIRSVFYRAAPE